MKTHSSELTRLYQSESGQAAAVVALFLFFVFLALASLAIDGAITYLGRRDLQNVADAAALAACTDLANNGTASTATITATRTIAANLGSSAQFVGSNPPSTNMGSGTGLAQGIEVSQPDVRVALLRPVPTVLTQFLGRGQSIINAKAHCNNAAGGGLLPIAVKHFDSNTLLDLIANSAANGNPPLVPYPTDSVTITVNGHYGPFPVAIPQPQYTASLANPGGSVSILDKGVPANNDNSFRGFVLLDMRNLAPCDAQQRSIAPEFYNGVSGNPQTQKSVSKGWISQHGYIGPIPDPGSQVAVLKGNSSDFNALDMARSGYHIDDIVPVFVYNGYDWTCPGYVLNFTPQISITSGYPTSAATAASYSVSVARDTNAGSWWGPINFFLTFSFSNGTASLPPSTHVVMNDTYGATDLMLQGLTYTVTNVTQSTPWSGTLEIYSDLAGPTPPTQTVQYLSGLNLVANSSIGVVSTKSSVFGFTTSSINPADYALRAGDNSMSAVLEQGSSIDLSFITFGANSVPPAGCSNLTATATVLGTTQPWSSFFSSSQTASVNVLRNQDSVLSPTFTLAALGTAPTGDYTLRFTVPASSCGPSHSLDVPLEINPAASLPSKTKFVVIEGYALFQITDMRPNQIFAKSVSPLLFDLSQISLGMRPRLVPWS